MPKVVSTIVETTPVAKTLPRRHAPGKCVIYFAAVGYGGEARQFYDHPERYDLVGDSPREMYERVAAYFNYPGGARALYELACTATNTEPNEEWT